MPDIAQTVSQQLARFGEPCTVSYKAVGSASSALDAATAKSVIRIGSRTSTVVAGQLTAAVNAQMPAMARSLQGATIKVGKRTYTVQSSTEMLYQGNVYLTKLVLT